MNVSQCLETVCLVGGNMVNYLNGYCDVLRCDHPEDSQLRVWHRPTNVFSYNLTIFPTQASWTVIGVPGIVIGVGTVGILVLFGVVWILRKK